VEKMKRIGTSSASPSPLQSAFEPETPDWRHQHTPPLG
jgi:hypothetical protein